MAVPRKASDRKAAGAFACLDACRKEVDNADIQPQGREQHCMDHRLDWRHKVPYVVADRACSHTLEASLGSREGSKGEEASGGRTSVGSEMGNHMAAREDGAAAGCSSWGR